MQHFKSLLLAIFLFHHVFSFSQVKPENKEVNLYVYEGTLIDVIKTIEKQSGVSFVYNTALMKNAQKITIDVKNTAVKTLLDAICNESGNDYKIINSQVVFYKLNAPKRQSFQILLDSNKKKNKPSTNQSTINLKKADSLNTPQTSLSTSPIDSSKIKSERSKLPQFRAFIITNPEVKHKPISLTDSLFYSHTQKAYNNKKQKKYTFSIESNYYVALYAGFKKKGCLTNKDVKQLNKSILSQGFSSGFNFGYKMHAYTLKTGVSYIQYNETYTVRQIRKRLYRQVYLREITWQKQDIDGIQKYTEPVSVSRTILKQEKKTRTKTQTYSYLEIPFELECSFSLKSKWSLFSSLQFGYTIKLNKQFKSELPIYNPNTFNKLNIAMGLSSGIKFSTQYLAYYFKLGGKTRTRLTFNNSNDKRNPIYLNIGLGINKYF